MAHRTTRQVRNEQDATIKTQDSPGKSDQWASHGRNQAMPHTLKRQVSSGLITHLQRTIGNQAVMRLLTANEQPANTPDQKSIQRYPATVLDEPIKSKHWSRHTKSVRKSDEGKSGGVYFFESSKKNDPVQKVVVKPELTDTGAASAEEAAFSETKLREAGFKVPKARTVAQGTDEETAIVAGTERTANPIGWNNLAYLRVMDVASGESLAKTLKKDVEPGQEAAKVDKAMELLSSSSFKVQLARLIATDIVLGSADRISHEYMNLGNLMINGTDIIPIDNESDLTPNLKTGAQKEALRRLAQDPESIIDNFLEGVVIHLRLESERTAGLFQQHELYRHLRAALIKALKDAALVVAMRDNKIGSGENAELMKKRQAILMDYLRS